MMGIRGVSGKIFVALTTFKRMIESSGIGFLDACGSSFLFLPTSLPLTKRPSFGRRSS
jgi:hypothetical protein